VLTRTGIYIGAGMIGLDGSMIRVLRRLITELVERPFVSQKSMNLMAKLTQKDLDTLGLLIAEGKVIPVIDRRYRLSEVPDAVRYLEQGHARGKVIIDLDNS
jgi:NADPH:quinone reductase-like Zn-dependent oxidoreductase